MNIILLEPAELAGGQAGLSDSFHAGRPDTFQVTLRDHRARHIRKVLKSQAGDQLKVGIVNGLLGIGRVLRVDDQGVSLAVHCATPPPAKAAIDLILALPRPIMLKRVLAQATSMGVERIMLVNAKRVEKSFWHSSQLEPQRLQEALRQGLEQAGDTSLPTLTLHQRFRPFIEDQLPALPQSYHLRLLAHPLSEQAGAPADQSPQPATTGSIVPPNRQSPALDQQLPPKTLLAVGPEGGWVDFELDCFRRQGFHCFSLGPRILRVDTAVPALLATLSSDRLPSAGR